MDVDWTLCPDDRPMELRLREVRNKLIKEKLLAGERVCYRSSGWSLWPRMSCGDMATYLPVRSADEVNIDDIVFCEVQPRNRFYAHLVKEKCMRQGQWLFTISNINGFENGDCRFEHIHGRLSEVTP